MTINEWAKDFKSYVNALDMQRDDYNGIMEYIDDAVSMLKEHEKDIEKRPIQNKDHPRFGMGYEYYDWICPTCRGFLAFETDEEHIPKRCPHCGQAVNLLKEQEEQIERIKERPDDAQMSDEDMAKYVAKLRDSIKIDLTRGHCEHGR